MRATFEKIYIQSTKHYVSMTPRRVEKIWKGLSKVPYHRTRLVLFSVFVILFFYVLTFNIGILPHTRIAQAQYGFCGDGVWDPDTEECDYTAPDPDAPCPYCYQRCSDSCECCDFRYNDCGPGTPIQGTCRYYDYCENGLIPGTSTPCPDCGAGTDICDNDYCSNVEENLCMDSQSLCHGWFEC